MSRFVTLLLTAPRRRVQALSFLLMNSYVLQGLKAIPCPGLNCYACPGAILACPIGTLQHFAILRQVPFYTLGVLGLIGVIVGRMACGWLCPFGWLQELLYEMRDRWQLRVWNISESYRWLPYGFLIVLVGIVPLLTMEPWFSKLCPMGTLEAGIPWVVWSAEIRAQVGWLFVVKLAILVAFLLWMMRTKRPFCRLVCPLGAIWSPFNAVSGVRLSVEESTCTQCGVCRQVCPVDISIYEDADSTRCVRCMECVKSCPESAVRLLGA